MTHPRTIDRALSKAYYRLMNFSEFYKAEKTIFKAFSSFHCIFQVATKHQPIFCSYYLNNPEVSGSPHQDKRKFTLVKIKRCFGIRLL